MADKKNLGDDVALYLFHQGNNMKAYEYMGCHKVKGEKNLFCLSSNCKETIYKVEVYNFYEFLTACVSPFLLCILEIVF